jgi:hypothetical protein
LVKAARGHEFIGVECLIRRGKGQRYGSAAEFVLRGHAAPI